MPTPPQPIVPRYTVTGGVARAPARAAATVVIRSRSSLRWGLLLVAAGMLVGSLVGLAFRLRDQALRAEQRAQARDGAAEVAPPSVVALRGGATNPAAGVAPLPSPPPLALARAATIFAPHPLGSAERQWGASAPAAPSSAASAAPRNASSEPPKPSAAVEALRRPSERGVRPTEPRRPMFRAPSRATPRYRPIARPVAPPPSARTRVSPRG